MANPLSDHSNSVEIVNGIVAVPTRVASGRSPVTPGDMAYIVLRLRELPAGRLQHLALGSQLGPYACGVCVALRERPDRYSDEEKAVADAILAWHGNDGLRCGVIYGTARALTLAATDEEDGSDV